MRRYSREGAHTLGRIADVPHFDVGRGDSEDQAGGTAVLDGHHVVGMSPQRHYLLPRHQVPHLAGAV